MLRLTIHPLDESVLVVAQTRDRFGNLANASHSGNASLWGQNPQIGYSAHPVGVQYPILDLDRMGCFDSVIRENDIQTVPSATPFYEYTQELADPDNGGLPTPFVVDPNDATRTLYLYMGSEFRFLSAYLELSTAGVWTSAALSVEYHNGNGWVAVPTKVEGSLLAQLAGQSDQVSWAAPTDWFPSMPEHSLSGAEGSRDVYQKRLFWVRVRLTTFVGFSSMPILKGAWEGDPRSEADDDYWPLVTRPEKPVLTMHQMAKDPNTHLANLPVLSQRAPAAFGSGLLDFGMGDYWSFIPTYGGSPVVGTDPALLDERTADLDKQGTTVTLKVPSRGVVLSPGKYRARVMAEVPNGDSSVLSQQTGHVAPPPNPDPPDPEDPEALFDPTWLPVLAAAVEHFDVRSRNTHARVELQRNASVEDSYVIWLERDGEHVPLQNQTDYPLDYARLIVQDAVTGAIVIDTMTTSATAAGPLYPLAGAGGHDVHEFRYLENVPARKMADRGQYLVTAIVVREGEAFTSTTSVAFFA
jgi:hypothetical protein